MLDGALCDLREEPDRRVRRRCPYHKRLCYGALATYYDTIRVYFDCGSELDYGYGYWRQPPRSRRRKAGAGGVVRSRAGGGYERSYGVR